MAKDPKHPIDEVIEDLSKSAGGYSALAAKIAENSADYQREVQSVLGSLQYEGLRDVFSSAGWKPANTTMEAIAGFAPFYYRRVGTATTLINKWPEWTWRRGVEIRSADTKFAEAANQLFNSMQVPDKLFRADKLSRVGRYGLLLLTHEDVVANSNAWKDPVTPNQMIIDIKPMMEKAVTSVTTTKDGRVMYSLKKTGSRKKSVAMLVDSSRVVHIADNIDESEFYGVPVIANVINELDDLIKISGSAGEAFYRYRGTFMLQQRVNKEGELVGFKDSEKKSDMMDAFRDYFLGLYSTLILSNVEAKQIADEPVSPKEWQDSVYVRIAAAKDIPKRLLIGSETGERASTEDLRYFATNIEARQKNHADPRIVRPMIDAFILAGMLDKPSEKGYEVFFPTVLIPTQEEVIKFGETLSKVNREQAAATGEAPFSSVEIRVALGFPAEEVEIV